MGWKKNWQNKKSTRGFNFLFAIRLIAEICLRPQTSFTISPKTRWFFSCSYFSPPFGTDEIYKIFSLFSARLAVKKSRTVAAQNIAMLSRLISSKAGNFSSPKVFYHLLSFSIRLSFILFVPRRADWEDAIKFMNARYQPTRTRKSFVFVFPDVVKKLLLLVVLL